MFNIDLLGRKKENRPDLDDNPAEDPRTLEDRKHHDIVVQTVLESAEKKAVEENVPVGEDFYLSLKEVPAKVKDVDLDILLPMRARRHGLLHIRTEEGSDTLRFERLACE